MEILIRVIVDQLAKNKSGPGAPRQAPPPNPPPPPPPPRGPRASPPPQRLQGQSPRRKTKTRRRPATASRRSGRRAGGEANGAPRAPVADRGGENSSASPLAPRDDANHLCVVGDPSTAHKPSPLKSKIGKEAIGQEVSLCDSRRAGEYGAASVGQELIEHVDLGHLIEDFGEAGANVALVADEK
jgi:hypothetical protein